MNDFWSMSGLHIPPSRWTKSQTIIAERRIMPSSTEIHWRLQKYSYKLGCYSGTPHRRLLEHRWVKRFVWSMDRFHSGFDLNLFWRRVGETPDLCCGVNGVYVSAFPLVCSLWWWVPSAPGHWARVTKSLFEIRPPPTPTTSSFGLAVQDLTLNWTQRRSSLDISKAMRETSRSLEVTVAALAAVITLRHPQVLLAGSLDVFGWLWVRARQLCVMSVT